MRASPRWDVGEEVLGVQGLDAGLGQHLEEVVVLAAGLVAVQDVVEQEALHHGGNHPVDLAAGPVNQDAPQASDFGIYS